MKGRELSQREQYQIAIDEARELGLTFDQESPPKLHRLREMIAEKVKEITNAEKLKSTITEGGDEDDISDLNLDGAFDEIMGETRGVLVRVTSWTEWMPTHPSEHEPRLSVEDGLTGFEAGKDEKVVSIETARTPLIKEVDIEVDGEKGKRQYVLYSFKATLAQNVKTTLLHELIADQDPGDEGRLVGGPGAQNGLVVTKEMPSPLQPQNRAQRRRGKG